MCTLVPSPPPPSSSSSVASTVSKTGLLFLQVYFIYFFSIRASEVHDCCSDEGFSVCVTEVSILGF